MAVAVVRWILARHGVTSSTGELPHTSLSFFFESKCEVFARCCASVYPFRKSRAFGHVKNDFPPLTGSDRHCIYSIY